MSDGAKKEPLPATRLARVFSDHPLEEETLSFEFEGFARTLAELAWNPDNRTPFTVVVRGGWGRGKTTLLRRTKWMLEHPQEVTWPAGEGEGSVQVGPPEGARQVKTVWFNAWKYPDDDTVLAGLLGAVIDGLRQGGMIDQLKHLLDSYGKGTLRGLMALAAPDSLRELIVKGVEDRYQTVHEKRAFHDTFRDLFSQVTRLLFDLQNAIRDTGGLSEDDLWNAERQRQQVVAIFLDDLDRCRQARVVEVIEAINLFLDLPGVCFFLGIDWDRLVAALPYTDERQAEQFLEKVVQVAFELPEVSPGDAQGYVKGLLTGAELAAVLGADGTDDDRDLRVVAQTLESRHPRHVKRFLNDLSMSLAVLRNTGKLGENEKRLPARAVVAWHLLSEVLDADRWRQVRALPQNLRKFLQDVELREAKGPPDEVEGEDSDSHREWKRIEASGLSERHLKALRDLSDDQRHLLVYLATPASVEVVKGRRSKARRDLFDLRSAAWVEIPGGTFWMGAQAASPNGKGHDGDARDNESPVHEVTVAPFRLSRHPVTNADYAAFVQETGKEPPRHWEEGVIPEGKEEHPVVNVSWTDAVAFCEWLTQRIRKAGAEGETRLPREAEWELAARGEAGRKYPWGSDPPSEERANFGMRVGDTTPVGSFPEGATPEGVLDLAGNVWEWCEDRYGPYREESEVDPIGPTAGASRVLRGGSFNDVPGLLRAAYRHGRPPGLRLDLVGFRLLSSRAGGLDS